MNSEGVPEIKTKAEYRCKHCNRRFRSKQAVISHLRFCKYRFYKRSVDLGPYHVTYEMNPSRRILHGINDTVAMLKRNKDLDDDYKFVALYGVSEFLQYAGFIKEYEVTINEQERDTMNQPC